MHFKDEGFFNKNFNKQNINRKKKKFISESSSKENSSDGFFNELSIKLFRK